MPLCWNWRIESGVPTATLFSRGNLVFPKSFIVCAVNLANIQSRWSRWLPLTCAAFRGSIVFYDLLIFWPGGYRVVLAVSNSCPPAAGWMEWNPKPGHNFCGRDQSFRFVLLLSRWYHLPACQLKKLTVSFWLCYGQFRLVTSGEYLSLPGMVTGNWRESYLSVFNSRFKYFLLAIVSTNNVTGVVKYTAWDD